MSKSQSVLRLANAVLILSEEIGSRWPFEEKHYPPLAEVPNGGQRRFSFLHMTLHLMKEAGILARIEERAQHRQGHDLPRRDWLRVQRLAMKAIVTGFRLLEVSGGTAEDLIRYIRRSQ